MDDNASIEVNATKIDLSRPTRIGQCLHRIGARRQILHLERLGPQEDAKDEVRRLALECHLASSETSFVAVEDAFPPITADKRKSTSTSMQGSSAPDDSVADAGDFAAVTEAAPKCMDHVRCLRKSMAMEECLESLSNRSERLDSLECSAAVLSISSREFTACSSKSAACCGGGSSRSRGRAPVSPPAPASLGLTLKLILLGDSFVGKTMLMQHFVDGALHDRCATSSIGIDFKTKSVERAGRTVKLQIWDTVGMDRFGPAGLPQAYYRNAHGALIVLDLTNAASLEGARRWLETVEDTRPEATVFLVGNKADQTDRRSISRDQAEKFADSVGLLYFEVSAVDLDELNSLFMRVTDKCLEAAA
jgi:small GTP-binding protein